MIKFYYPCSFSFFVSFFFVIYQVKYAIHRHTRCPVAVKIMNHAKIKEQKMTSKVVREINILKQCAHPYVMRMFETINTPTDMFVICEYVKGGELFEYIVDKGRIDPFEARRIFRQLIDGVEYLHNNLICHRDLKVNVAVHVFTTFISI
jgi:5'-AMP-activated protein kinase, catalytic alpha subunit